MKPIVVLTCLIAALLALSAQAQQGNARMYKCIDTDGKVHYSDRMNPDCGQISELNRQGVVMKKREVAKPGQPSKADPAAATPKNSKEQRSEDHTLKSSHVVTCRMPY